MPPWKRCCIACRTQRVMSILSFPPVISWSMQLTPPDIPMTVAVQSYVLVYSNLGLLICSHAGIWRMSNAIEHFRLRTVLIAVSRSSSIDSVRFRDRRGFCRAVCDLCNSSKSPCGTVYSTTSKTTACIAFSAIRCQFPVPSTMIERISSRPVASR